MNPPALLPLQFLLGASHWWHGSRCSKWWCWIYGLGSWIASWYPFMQFSLRPKSRIVSFTRWTIPASMSPTRSWKPLWLIWRRSMLLIDEQVALAALDNFGECLDKKYPKIPRSWRNNWVNLSTNVKYPHAIRRQIYTTNAIDGSNRQLSKVTKAKSVFPPMTVCWKCCMWLWWASRKVDGSAIGLEHNPCPNGGLFRWANAE